MGKKGENEQNSYFNSEKTLENNLRKGKAKSEMKNKLQDNQKKVTAIEI